MNVIGVDPSLTCTGLARIIDGDVQVDRIKTSPVGAGLDATRVRIRYIVGQVLRFAPEHCLTVIEAPYVPARMRAGAVIERAWLYGLLVDQLSLRGPVVRVAPAIRAMYATGKGNAAKAAVVAAMRSRFPRQVIDDDNVADALALAAMGARHMGSPVDGDLGFREVAAMDAVEWKETN